MALKDEELININGGGSLFTGTIINAFVRGINALLDLGRSVGSAIRRVKAKSICSL